MAERAAPGSITTYLQQHLARQLAIRGLTDEQIAPITVDVGSRLASLLVNWNDRSLRQTLLLVGREEAIFYEPTDADPDVRSLVVVAVRNSLVENLASTTKAARQHGLADPVLHDRDIPDITQTAIRYFRTLDLTEIGRALAYASSWEDVFGYLSTQYPIAWRAFAELAGLSGAESPYTSIQAKPPDLAVGLPLPPGWQAGTQPVHVVSGMERAIEPQLQRVLRMVKHGVVPVLFADSFKMITRNPEKLFEIVEFVLGNEHAVVTHNYYLENGYVARRNPLLRPAHVAQQVRRKFQNRSGLSEKHDLALRQVADYV